MNLIIDIGNTRTKYAIFKHQKMVFEATADNFNLLKLNAFLREHNIDTWILSSVVTVPENYSKALLNYCKGLVLDYKTPLPISVKYDTPKTLGNDRLANVVAAASKYANNNVLVIDVGTCLKFDFVTNKGEYLGGSIAPGLQMRFKALEAFTDQLPLVTLNTECELIGNTTKNSILSGVYKGMTNEIKQGIAEYNRLYDKLTVILTGGDMKYFDKALKSSIFAHPNLTALGLNEILQHNS